MYSMRKLVKAMFTHTPVGVAVYWTLQLSASTLLVLNRLVGTLYTRMWAGFGISWFDHRFDYLIGPQNWHWTERGVFAARLVRKGDRILDLGCGDGFYSALYYSGRGNHVDAVDVDHRTIQAAKSRFRMSNVHFRVLDAVDDAFPAEEYGVICFFAVIEHLSDDSGLAVLQKIGRAMQERSVLIGSTPLFKTRGGHNEEHDNEFFAEAQLSLFLDPHFDDVRIHCSQWPGRIDAYFECRGARSLSVEERAAALQRYRDFLDRQRIQDTPNR